MPMVLEVILLHVDLFEACDAERHPGLPARAPSDLAEAWLREIQERLVQRFPDVVTAALTDPAARRETQEIIGQMLAEAPGVAISPGERQALAVQLTDRVSGLGPLEPLLRDPDVSEVMVVGHDRVYVDVDGRILPTEVRFRDWREVVEIAQRVVAPLGRELTESTPYAEGRLPGRVRVTAAIPPFSHRPSISIRKHRPNGMGLDDLVSRGTLSAPMSEFLKQCLRARVNLLIAGPTGSGKTTVARALAAHIPPNERLFTVEETLELYLSDVHPHVVELETRAPDRAGRHEISIEVAIRHALHMRPDRILVGEIRGAEAMQLLTAMGTGHRGSFSTIHAGDASEVFDRLVLAMLEARSTARPEQLERYAARSLEVIVCLERDAEGERRVATVSEVCLTGDGMPDVVDLFRWRNGQFERRAEPGPRLRAILRQPGLRRLHAVGGEGP